jgi:hypothetical protein
LAYQPPDSITFLSEQTNHQQSVNSIFLSEQTSTSHHPPAKRTGWWLANQNMQGLQAKEEKSRKMVKDGTK